MGGSSRSRVRGALALTLGLVFAGCGFAPTPRGANSYGFPNKGALLRGVSLPERGPGFVRAKAGEDTRWGAEALVGLIVRASERVARAHPGAAPLYVGDLSSRYGGAHALHGSHRTGRDADMLFYLSDTHGHSVRGSGFYAFDGRGVSTKAAAAAPLRDLAFFDDARNWTFVRELVMDSLALVQWIFCSDGVKARLLAYAAAHERDPEALVRASYVLHQPSRGRIHDDHFHIRIGCSAQDRTLGCMDQGPVWPWFRNEHEKTGWEGPGNDDATLVRALLGDDAGLAATGL